jgi:hypothetical protein
MPSWIKLILTKESVDWFITLLGFILSSVRSNPMGRHTNVNHWSNIKLQYYHYISGRALVKRGIPVVPPWIDPVTFQTLPEFEDAEPMLPFDKE